MILYHLFLVVGLLVGLWSLGSLHLSFDCNKLFYLSFGSQPYFGTIFIYSTKFIKNKLKKLVASILKL